MEKEAFRMFLCLCMCVCDFEKSSSKYICSKVMRKCKRTISNSRHSLFLQEKGENEIRMTSKRSPKI